MKLFMDMVRKQGAGGTEIGAGLISIETEGHHVLGKGAARYVYDAAVNAAFVTKFPRLAFLAADGRGFRLALDQQITLHMLGAKGDGVTDDHPALQNALLFLAEFNTNVQFLEAGGSRNFMRSSIPIFGSPGRFYMSDTWEWTDGITYFDGQGSGMGGHHNYCILEFAASKHGIRVQRTDTEREIRTHKHGWGADGSTIRNCMLLSKGGTGLFHGIRTRARIYMENVGVFGFPGDGINIVATSGHESDKQGNANYTQVHGGFTRDNGRHGVYLTGADANACYISGVDSAGNKGWGFFDDSFLGNTFIGCHTDANVGGPYMVVDPNARSVIIGCYSEANQPSSSISQHSIIVGGLHAAGDGKILGAGTELKSFFGSIEAKSFTAAYGGGLYSVQLGSGGQDGFLSMRAGPNNYEMRAAGTEFQFGLGATSSPPMIMTGGGTPRTFGRASAQPHKLAFSEFALGNHGNGEARLITMAENAPTTGEHARGEIVFNNFGNAANDAVEYWRCTRSGTPGTWVARS